MNGSRAASLAVALLCITAIGVSATTLESTLTTDPDEEIDPEYELLPIGQDDAFDLQQQMEGDGEPIDSDDSDPTEGAGDETKEPEESSEDEGQSSAADTEDRNGDSGSGDEGTDSGSATGTGTGAGTPDLLDRLLAALLAILRVLLPLLAALSVVALAVRYRERIAATVAAVLASDGPVERPADPVETWPRSAPANPVDRAWLTMVRQADPDRPDVMTPAECAAAARDAGLDPAAVAAITRAFERVHYGGRHPSSEIERAESGLRRLQNADGGTPAGDRPRGGQSAGEESG